MFTVDELRDALDSESLQAALAAVRQALAPHRLDHAEPAVEPETAERLESLVSAVLVSAPHWAPTEGLDVTQRAGEAAELLGLGPIPSDAAQARLRAALLYELASMPSMAAAVIGDGDGARVSDRLLQAPSGVPLARRRDPD